ncbi:glycoside hydrolase family 16 protein [Azospirillum sp. ST 5-10]|uniref:glycoside hydrolase family 16 protein n=1 Tax=unclassified Azospirillum TaxID=2630922 RepID=UPI003F4A1193
MLRSCLQALFLAILLAAPAMAGDLPVDAAGRVDPSRMTLTFADDFDGFDLWDGTGGTWRADTRSGRGVIARQATYYVNPADAADAVFGFDPFSVSAGILSIEAREAGAHAGERTEGRTYLSGLITTEPSFAQQYGYFEVRARLPDGKGMWPAFWLRPVKRGWPPEIDVMEVLGDRPSTVYLTLHTREGGKRSKAAFRAEVPGTAEDFHTYGLAWTPDYVAWFVDGRERARTRTPDDMHTPMYLLINLGVGGKWPGMPDADTAFPARMLVDYARAYRF